MKLTMKSPTIKLATRDALRAELAALSAKKLTDCSAHDIYRFKTLTRWLSCT